MTRVPLDQQLTYVMAEVKALLGPPGFTVSEARKAQVVMLMSIADSLKIARDHLLNCPQRGFGNE